MPGQQVDNWVADDYAAHSGGQQAWALANLEGIRFRGDERVLDIGCGDGKISAVIASRVPQGEVVGIDYSADMVRHATDYWQSRVDNLAFEQQDAAALDIAGEFDFVFSNSTLHWVPDHDAVAAGIARTLKPGGRVFLSFGAKGTASAVHDAIAEFQRDGQWAEYLQGAETPLTLHDEADWLTFLQRHQLISERVELRPRAMLQPDRAALKGWIRTTKSHFVQCAPEAQRAQFLEHLTDATAARCKRSDDGGFLVPMVNLEVEARKSI